MMPRTPTIVGAALGLAAAALVLGYTSTRHTPPAGVMLPDYGGAIRTAIMQYTAGSQFVAPVFREFLTDLPASVTIYLACPERADYDEIRPLIGDIRCTLIPTFTHHAMTAWSRDRWVAITGLPDHRITLLAPAGESEQEIWPQRAGDARLADDLARAFPDHFSSARSPLYFDGGDYLADGPFVFATRALLERNLQHTVTTRDKLLQAIAYDLHLNPILMDPGPDHHAGMFMMSAGPAPHSTPVSPPTPLPSLTSTSAAQPRMIVADPSLGEKFFEPASPETPILNGGPDFSPETQARFDSIAQLATDHGYQVTRIPVVTPKSGKTYLTYVNVLLDQRAGHPLVYLPTFTGQPRMNAAAAEVWRSLGYQVHPIDCSTVWDKGGTLHCLVNVVERAPPSP